MLIIKCSFYSLSIAKCSSRLQLEHSYRFFFSLNPEKPILNLYEIVKINCCGANHCYWLSISKYINFLSLPLSFYWNYKAVSWMLSPIQITRWGRHGIFWIFEKLKIIVKIFFSIRHFDTWSMRIIAIQLIVSLVFLFFLPCKHCINEQQDFLGMSYSYFITVRL